MAARVMLLARSQKLFSISGRNDPGQFIPVQNQAGTNITSSRYASWFISKKGVQKTVETESVPDQEVADHDAELEVEVRAEEQKATDAKRDVSRLPEKMKPFLEHNFKMPERIFEHDFKPSRERKFYAYFGSASNIDPRVAWPTKDELVEMQEFESEWEPSLQERWGKLRQEQEEEMAQRQVHEANVEKAMARMPEYIEQFRKKLAKQEHALEAQEKKRKGLVEEARDYFGYNIDPRDPRFTEMQEKKAEEEVKLKRKQRKEQKEMKMEAALERIKAESENFKKAQSSSQS